MERKTNEAGKRPAAGLAIASLVLGILAVVLSFLLVGGVLGVIGLGLGLVHLRTKDRPPSLAGAGMVLSIVGNMATLGFGRIYYSIYEQIQEAGSHKPAHAVASTTGPTNAAPAIQR
jgi:hypothetical protein